MTTFQLTMISYVLICSGSYGIEVTVKSAGTIYAIIGVILTSIFLSSNQALICSILSIFYPKNGSTVQWINCVNVNPKAKLLIKLLYANTLALKAVIDNSTYPAMFSDYLSQLFQVLNVQLPSYSQYIVSILIIVVCFLINLFGIHTVEMVQYIFIILNTFPIVLECILSWFNYEYPLPKLESPDKIDWNLLLSTLLWCCSGFDQLTDLSGEVYNLVGHERQYVIAFLSVCILQTITYIVPIISLSYIQPDITQWDSGAFVSIADLITNKWLSILLAIGGCISAFGIENNCITCTMQELQQSCKENLLPFSKIVNKQLKINQKYRINLQSLLVITVIPVIISMLGFEIIVELDAFLISMAMCLCIIFYWIRVWQSNDKDEYLQLNKKQKILLTICGLIPFIINIFLLVVQGWQTLLLYLILQIILIIIYVLSQKCGCNDIQYENNHQNQFVNEKVNYESINM